METTQTNTAKKTIADEVETTDWLWSVRFGL